MYDVTVRCPGSPSLDTLGPLLEALTEANAQWYLNQWDAGKRPATTCAQAGVLYRPHRKAARSTWHGAAEILGNPSRGWSCQECAALEAGAERAAMIWDGVNADEARGACHCYLEDRGDNDYHALVLTPSGYIDPTRGLRT